MARHRPNPRSTLQVSRVVELVAVFLVLLAGCAFVSGGSDDFRMDAAVGRAVVEGVDPHQPMTAYRIPVDNAAFRTAIALMLSMPLGLIPEAHLLAAAAVFVASTGLLLIIVLNRHGYSLLWAATIFLWPFSEVDKHGKWTFLLAALLLLAFQHIDRPVLSGLLISLAVGLNLWPAVVAVALLLTGRWRVAISSAAWFVALTSIMLTTSVSVSGTLSTLGQDPFVNPENLSLLRWLPLWTIPVGVLIYSAWAYFQTWQRAARVAVLVGLALSPVVWAAYFPSLVAALPSSTELSGAISRRVRSAFGNHRASET